MEYIIVQAGGKGTRLKHLTKNKPKALVPIDNLPMIFHLFRKYPDKRFIIIADYHKEVLREYLGAFAEVKYQVADAKGSGTCSGILQALEKIPEHQPFMLIWSDLILPEEFRLPDVYEKEHISSSGEMPDYIGISKTFPCRWSYAGSQFVEERSSEHGVAGFFLFRDKAQLSDVPESGEFVRWMQSRNMVFEEISLAGTREFGLLEEYEKLGREKCRPFNRITVDGDVLVKEAVDEQGKRLAVRECAWYEKAKERNSKILPRIYDTNPLRMEYIKGKNIYECQLSYEEKRKILGRLISALHELHQSESIPADSFSMKEAYFNKTMDRLRKIEDLVPFAREKTIRINGKECRNVYFYKRELEKKLEELTCNQFSFIHGDCTFSNLMLREDGSPVLIDPRGYFGFTELYGDMRYDWAKLYYSIAGNYDQFNLKNFRLEIGENEVALSIQPNHWEDMEQEFFALTGADPGEIKLLHAVIWLSLTTYAWQDYDSICGAFYNGLYYLEDVL
ncbi:MAG: NTP transferase domain-containing protein [Lachnospiraceae bacterium]|nr:NTP transferase domain-containing protein [Lachnospiraceae bacterium]